MADFQVSRFPSQEVVERDQYEINILCWYWIGFYTGWWMFECLMLMWRSEEIFPLNIIWSNQWSLYGLRCETCQRVFKSTSTLIRELLIHNIIFTVVSYSHNPSPSSSQLYIWLNAKILTILSPTLDHIILPSTAANFFFFL